MTGEEAHWAGIGPEEEEYDAALDRRTISNLIDKQNALTAELERVRESSKKWELAVGNMREQRDFALTKLAAVEAVLEDVVAAQLHRVDDLVGGITRERDALREQVARLFDAAKRFSDEDYRIRNAGLRPEAEFFNAQTELRKVLAEYAALAESARCPLQCHGYPCVLQGGHTGLCQRIRNEDIPD